MKTNFERITQSPEALAKALAGIIDCAACPAECKEYKNQTQCHRDIVAWLKADKNHKGINQ